MTDCGSQWRWRCLRFTLSFTSLVCFVLFGFSHFGCYIFFSFPLFFIFFSLAVCPLLLLHSPGLLFCLCPSSSPSLSLSLSLGSQPRSHILSFVEILTSFPSHPFSTILSLSVLPPFLHFFFNQHLPFFPPLHPLPSPPLPMAPV